ncbi:sensor histidine kinase [Xanthomonas campestris]|uniref:sensor histidine kinase n=1 Tax=Xanthomonas campestris TaxID=339 RepID=UPI001D1483F4|nr:sensor histidine kinase KdpD [Xanthomonas campestris]MCC3252810.1 sensor histidine kinase KdpD [Xanthomonas campestris pv. armoraciae]MEA0762317.1 sensor histidine kinase KdpD [Xanthomonas campestris pv. campestris]MEB1102001.1 sensor histidine kinase KdpD [Xanthomonas campestris pv. campestris]MEB1224866.1 sensor histidine kinase KdpD [Xanthomonas campestris pv. campestris]MEB1245561.1 sensor histidine kinase KdpD [Xanthomonas campestris pv. campestris]
MSDARTQHADALIGELQREHGGRLTVFLGAAPGVGKTYAMLSRARERLRQGVDVVAGVVETHGRSETAALLDGVPLLPRAQVSYQGHALEELALDALLARKPQLALIDELAHRNVPGSRHERRWQDIVELLDAGIDVYTTVNIQHLESLNDIVLRITGVRVSETVPDAVFDRLRDIVLVDLPPRELIERLQQGKVYLPEQASQALQAFFSPSNLTALRELAMQTAADRVDSDLRDTQAARGLPGTAALRRHVVVAIDGRGSSDYLVRVARRLSERRDAPWTVVTVQTRTVADAAWQLEIDRAFALTRRLGGDTALLHGANVADALLDFASQNGVSTLVLGRTRERPLARMFNRTLTQQLLQRGAHYELVIVSSGDARARARQRWRNPGQWLQRYDLAYAAIAAAAAVAVAWVIQRWTDIDDLSMVFIVAVVLVASRTRMAAAVIAALLSFVAYNFFFIEPRFTLHISARQGVVTVCLFLIAALVAGRLASRLRSQVLALRAANAHANALQALARQLSTAADLGQVLEAGRRALASALDAEVWLRLEQRESEASTSFSALDRNAADWTQRHGQPAGRFTDTLAGAQWWCLPVRHERGTLGVAALRFRQQLQRQRPGLEQRRLAEAMVEDIGQAALRTRLVADLEGARVSGETERLRSALLSSVSHDLRSPLASMIGSASSLAEYGEAMDATDRRSLLETIQLEGERLDRYIQNLLDMTRLGHTGLTLKRDWIGVDELIGSATRRLQRYQPQVRLQLDLVPELPAIWVHPALVEQAIFNVLENAAKFSPPGVAVTVQAQLQSGALQIEIGDQGPGIPEDERARIFDMFYSVERGDRGRHGTGLGLTICQGMIGAHGGSVEALAGPHGHGTTIRITLPLLVPAAPPRPDAD